MDLSTKFGKEIPSRNLCENRSGENSPFYEGLIPSLLRTPGCFTTRPLPVYLTTELPFVSPMWVLSKDEIGATSVSACGMLQGWGLEAWGLGLADLLLPRTQARRTECKDESLGFREHCGVRLLQE